MLIAGVGEQSLHAHRNAAERGEGSTLNPLSTIEASESHPSDLRVSATVGHKAEPFAPVQGIVFTEPIPAVSPPATAANGCGADNDDLLMQPVPPPPPAAASALAAAAALRATLAARRLQKPVTSQPTMDSPQSASFSAERAVGSDVAIERVVEGTRALPVESHVTTLEKIHSPASISDSRFASAEALPQPSETDSRLPAAPPINGATSAANGPSLVDSSTVAVPESQAGLDVAPLMVETPGVAVLGDAAEAGGEGTRGRGLGEPKVAQRSLFGRIMGSAARAIAPPPSAAGPSRHAEGEPRAADSKAQDAGFAGGDVQNPDGEHIPCLL